jgi:hypothetical protein
MTTRKLNSLTDHPDTAPTVVIADRNEDEPCERGTVGCAVNHTASGNAGCETW